MFLSARIQCWVVDGTARCETSQIGYFCSNLRGICFVDISAYIISEFYALLAAATGVMIEAIFITGSGWSDMIVHS